MTTERRYALAGMFGPAKYDIGQFTPHAGRLRMQVRQAMLQAGIAWRLEGEAGLAKHPDPTAKQPFLLKKSESSPETRFDLFGHHPLGTGLVVLRFDGPE